MAVNVQQEVAALYSAIFNRAPDQAGLEFWVNAIEGGDSLVTAAEGFTQHPVFAETYADLTGVQFVQQLYVNVLGSAGDAKGIQFWADKLASGVSQGQVVAEFVQGSLNIDLEALLASGELTQADYDAAVVRQDSITNKATVGVYFAETFGAASNLDPATDTTTAEGLAADPVYLASQAAIAGVTADAASVAAAKAAIDAAASPGEAFTLTNGVDTPALSANADTIEGAVSALTAENTLNTTDVIDGGEGVDTLKVDLQSNFTGFTTAGKLANVENIELTNSGTIGRNFDATGVTGAQKYVLNAGDSSISLSNLAAAGVAVDVVGQKSGTATIGFTTKAVEGTADALTVGVNGVGTAEVKDAAGVVTTAAKYVTVAATGIENLTVNATGANLVNLAGAATKTITAAGEGSLNVEAVGAVTSFDASGLTGAVTANLTGAAAGTLATVKGGAGDDVVTVDLADLTANATISGGAGANTLKVSGTGTIQPTLSQFQTLELNGITGNSTISAKNISDLATLAVKGTAPLANTVTVAGLNSAALSVVTEGTQGGTIQLTSPTVLTYGTTSTAANATAKTQEAVSTVITANEATNATINVGAYTTQTGAISLNKATAVTLNVATGKSADATPVERTSFDAKLTANAAQSVIVKADGVLGANTQIVAGAATLADITAIGGGKLDLDVAKAQQVNITAGAALDLATSTFTAAEQVTIAANVGHVDGTAVALGKISTLNLSGTGTAATKLSQVTLGALGSADISNAITVTATGLKGGVTLGAIDTNAANVTLTATEATGAVDTGAIGGIKAVGNVTVNAATLGSTDVAAITTVKGATVQINATGLLGKDASGYALKVGAVNVADDGAAKSGTITATISGSNDLDIGTLNAKTVTLDLSGYLGGNVDGTGTGAVAKVDEVTGQNVTIKGSELGANTLTSNVVLATGQTSTLAVTGGLQGDTLNVKGAITSANAATISFTGGDGVDTIVFANAADLTAANSKLTLNSVENLTATGAVTVWAADVTGKTLAVTPTSAFTVKGTDAADTIDASNITGDTTAANFVINGGKGADTIKLSSATGDAQTVVVNVTSATGAYSTESSATAYDKVSNFTLGKDKVAILDTDSSAAVFSVSTAATSTASDLVTASITGGVVTKFVVGNAAGDGTVDLAATDARIDTLAEILAILDAQATTVGEAVSFVFGDNQYIWAQNDAADVLVELTGVTTGATLNAASSVLSLA